jgi:hypothetical protein
MLVSPSYSSSSCVSVCATLHMLPRICYNVNNVIGAATVVDTACPTDNRSCTVHTRSIRLWAVLYQSNSSTARHSSQ